MKLILADDEGVVIENWTLKEDPDIFETLSCELSIAPVTRQQIDDELAKHLKED